MARPDVGPFIPVPRAQPTASLFRSDIHLRSDFIRESNAWAQVPYKIRIANVLVYVSALPST